MSDRIDKQLIKAVKEYYEWHKDIKAKPIRFVKNNHSDYTMLLVRFTDEQGEEMSSLMITEDWADGHWDVTEIVTAYRDCENSMVQNFQESEEYAVWTS